MKIFKSDSILPAEQVVHSDKAIEQISLGEDVTGTLPDGEIPLTRRQGDVLYVPIQFLKQQPEIVDWLDPLNELIRSGSPSLYATPWILGSGMFDIAGAPRTSRSHAQGRAMDISPMEDETVILTDSRKSAALAWNLLSLAHFSTWSSQTVAWVVEGDHIHCALSPNAGRKSEGVVLSCPTSSDWYAHRQLEDPRVAEHLFGHLFLFKNGQKSLNLNPADSQISDMLIYLNEASEVQPRQTGREDLSSPGYITTEDVLPDETSQDDHEII